MPNDSTLSSENWDRPAYLLIRDGSSWRDVFRLMPGKVTTIGRAPTNRIVLSDEVCSRNHCEIFQNGPHWTLRDLNSRNGTLVSGEQVESDWELEDGEIVQIGDCEIGFTFDISKPFQPFVESTQQEYLDRINDTATDISIQSPGNEGGSSAEIIHRTQKSRFREAPADELVGREHISLELASLYRLALEMGDAANSRELARGWCFRDCSRRRRQTSGQFCFARTQHRHALAGSALSSRLPGRHRFQLRAGFRVSFQDRHGTPRSRARQRHYGRLQTRQPREPG